MHTLWYKRICQAPAFYTCKTNGLWYPRGNVTVTHSFPQDATFTHLPEWRRRSTRGRILPFKICHYMCVKHQCRSGPTVVTVTPVLCRWSYRQCWSSLLQIRLLSMKHSEHKDLERWLREVCRIFFFFAEEDSSSSIGFTSVTIDPDGDSEIYLKKENKMWVKIFIETFQTAPPPWPIFPPWICTFSVFQTVIALPIRTKHNTLSSNTDTVLHERSVNNHSVLCCVVLNNMRREVTVDVLTLI